MKERLQKRLTNMTVLAMKILPPAFALLLILGAVLVFTHIRLDQLGDYVQNNIFWGIMAILVIYGVKSLTVVFPVPVLYAVVGTLFPTPAAMAVNLAGLTVELMLPYGLGRLAGTELHRYILEKYPKAKAVADFKEKHNFFMIYMIRLIGIFSVDLTSMMMGSSRLPFKNYLAGSLLGMLPTLLIVTFLGANVTDPKSPEFLIAAGLTVALLLISFVLYKKYKTPTDS